MYSEGIGSQNDRPLTYQFLGLYWRQISDIFSDIPVDRLVFEDLKLVLHFRLKFELFFPKSTREGAFNSTKIYDHKIDEKALV